MSVASYGLPRRAGERPPRAGRTTASPRWSRSWKPRWYAAQYAAGPKAGARWEQAFSTDDLRGGETWLTNSVMELTRA
ncbi:hypothetical protein [Streptomyces caelestis]|uniref:hypothetical protein n=1 Tax=Streptomyces caelestis TaxID=36816 RepID=UPI0036F66F87